MKIPLPLNLSLFGALSLIAGAKQREGLFDSFGHTHIRITRTLFRVFVRVFLARLIFRWYCADLTVNAVLIITFPFAFRRTNFEHL